MADKKQAPIKKAPSTVESVDQVIESGDYDNGFNPEDIDRMLGKEDGKEDLHKLEELHRQEQAARRKEQEERMRAFEDLTTIGDGEGEPADSAEPNDSAKDGSKGNDPDQPAGGDEDLRTQVRELQLKLEQQQLEAKKYRYLHDRKAAQEDFQRKNTRPDSTADTDPFADILGDGEQNRAVPPQKATQQAPDWDDDAKEELKEAAEKVISDFEAEHQGLMQEADFKEVMLVLAKDYRDPLVSGSKVQLKKALRMLLDETRITVAARRLEAARSEAMNKRASAVERISKEKQAQQPPKQTPAQKQRKSKNIEDMSDEELLKYLDAYSKYNRQRQR